VAGSRTKQLTEVGSPLLEHNGVQEAASLAPLIPIGAIDCPRWSSSNNAASRFDYVHYHVLIHRKRPSEALDLLC